MSVHPIGSKYGREEMSAIFERGESATETSGCWVSISKVDAGVGDMTPCVCIIIIKV